MGFVAEKPGKTETMSFGVRCRFRVSATPNDNVFVSGLNQGIWAADSHVSNFPLRLFRGSWMRGGRMRWDEDGADEPCHLRALFASGEERWDAYWLPIGTEQTVYPWKCHPPTPKSPGFRRPS
jgi:hypothetical protein